jgi:hypothetical protein
MDTQEAKQGAQTILRQLGGGQFLVMTGAKYISYEEKADYPNVSFRFPMCQKANYCKIALDWSDTYKVTFLKIRGVECKTVKEIDGVYCDMLQDIFTQETGLYCTLGTMGRQ